MGQPSKGHSSVRETIRTSFRCCVRQNNKVKPNSEVATTRDGATTQRAIT